MADTISIPTLVSTFLEHGRYLRGGVLEPERNRVDLERRCVSVMGKGDVP
jgi:hypothetical protein